MKIVIIRNATTDPLEWQSYSPLKEKFNIQAITTKSTAFKGIDLPVTKLWSPTDLPNFPFKYPILNHLFTDAHQIYGLEKAIKRADIVHTDETYFGYTHQAIQAKRKGKVKNIICTVRETIPHQHESSRGLKSYKNLAKIYTDHFIATTHRAKEALLKEGFRAHRISIIPTGIDLTRFSPTKTPKTKRDINILCVADLVPEKGVKDLLKAFVQIYSSDIHLRLTFVGSGPLKLDLSGYKNVHIKTVSYPQMPSVYHQADIFCLPSRVTKNWEESTGESLIEALACGLPIVTTLSGAIPEICGEAVIYSQPSDSQSLKTNLEKLIYNEELRRKMGQLARKRAVEKYDREKIARQIADLYQKVCPSKNS